MPASQSELPAFLRPASSTTSDNQKHAHSSWLHSALLPPSALFNSTSSHHRIHVNVTPSSFPRPHHDSNIPFHDSTQDRVLPGSPILAFYADSEAGNGTDDAATMDVDCDDDDDDDDDDFDHDDQSNETGHLPLCSFILRTVRQESQDMLPTQGPAIDKSAPLVTLDLVNELLQSPPPKIVGGQAMDPTKTPLAATPPASRPPFVPGVSAPPCLGWPSARADSSFSDTFSAPTINPPTSPTNVSSPPALPQTRSFPSTSSALYMPYLQPISHMYSKGYAPSAAVSAYTSIHQLPSLSSAVSPATVDSNYTLPPLSPPRATASAPKPTSRSPDSPAFADNPYAQTVTSTVTNATPRDRSATAVRRWTDLEYSTLERAMVTFGRNWKLIDRMHGQNGVVDQILARFTPSHLSSKSSYEVCRKRQLLKMTDEQIGIMATACKGRQMSMRQEREVVARYIQEVTEERRQAAEMLKAEEKERHRLAGGARASAAEALRSVVRSSSQIPA
ncbi:hypothetical protein BCR44DRAFT_38096 [Catenaria anguillulae PL171]|uniref:Uncharacterized protein n=1 Tax=Catenaria anguillulae PL171 TaxID=765915 RepID=A0A1Y2I379_9FUNG|nr:hypothetical protein BCR44DRAFT_38096 [Catenaria anguillulae PL171]